MQASVSHHGLALMNECTSTDPKINPMRWLHSWSHFYSFDQNMNTLTLVWWLNGNNSPVLIKFQVDWLWNYKGIYGEFEFWYSHWLLCFETGNHVTQQRFPTRAVLVTDGFFDLLNVDAQPRHLLLGCCAYLWLYVIIQHFVHLITENS